MHQPLGALKPIIKTMEIGMRKRIIIYTLLIYSVSLSLISIILFFNKETISSQLILLSIGVVAMLAGVGLLSLDQRLRKLEEKNQN